MPTWPRILGSSSSSSSSSNARRPSPSSEALLPSLSVPPRLAPRQTPHGRSKSQHMPPPPNSSQDRRRSSEVPVPLRRSEGDLLDPADLDVGGFGMSRRNGPGGAAELTTGPCMCCDTSIRWPSHLPTFRCTVCMTVNDLKPAKAAVGGSTEIPPRKPPLSINTLKAIIDVSLQDFLATDINPRGIPLTVGTGIARPLKSSAGLSPENPEAAPEDASAPPSRPPPSPPMFSGALSCESGEIGATPESPIAVGARRHAEKLFKPLEEYIRTSFSSWECLNASFSQSSGTETNNIIPEPQNEESAQPSRDAREVMIPVTNNPGEKEALMLTVGRAARRERTNSRNERAFRSHETRPSFRPPPEMDWDLAHEFYNLVLNVGRDALVNLSMLRQCEGEAQEDPEAVRELGYAIDEARINMVNVLLKSTEGLLKRPGRPLKKPEDIRFLLVILANPMLYPGAAQLTSNRPPTVLVPSQAQPGVQRRESLNPATRKSSSAGRDSSMNHSAILKRIFGLLSNLPNECHHFLITWFSIMPENHFRRLVELGGSFTTYRIGRQDTKKTIQRHNILRGKLPYSDDWQIKATARVMALLEKANNNSLGRRKHLRSLSSSGSAAAWRQEAHSRGQIIPSSSFYNMRVDYCDLIADFDAWESKLAKFCFCQYPFFLSMGAKIQILEHDARRQMEIQARNAFITNISNRTALSQYMVLRVRRECLVEDSLKGISESAGTIDDLKKGLKVEFVGEDGIDAGGLKKEWFLMVAREVFDPNHGLFVSEEKASCCYFNPHTFESSEEFYLVGVLLGLAIYNSTILDVSLPPYVFRKLIYFAPHYGGKGGPDTRSRPPFRRSLDDLAAIRPELAVGLQQLLDFEGNVEETFCRDFVAETDKYGEKIITPLCPGGENRPVTNANRKEFVDLYLKHILDTSITRQFEPFKRGFYTVCGGNALSLFGPEEIELLVRGSAEPLDVQALKAVAVYDGWSSSDTPESDTVVRWFWSFFEKSSPLDQRKLLGFITGSDRIPAMGATNLIIKIVCLGQDCDRFPVARTCFNQICLWRYKKREKFERLLWRAVTESEGFGLK